jgi:RNA polymerase sigma-B factor
MLEKLGPRDRVLLLRVHFELTQAEIARRIGVSQMQVSRILRKSIRTTTAPTPA